MSIVKSGMRNLQFGRDDFGVNVRKVVNTNIDLLVPKKCPKAEAERQEELKLFTPAELEVIASGKIEVIETIWFRKKKDKKSKRSEKPDYSKDTCFLEDVGDSDDAHYQPPGSQARIESLKKFYENNPESTPFVATDDEIAEEFVNLFVENKLIHNKTSGKEFTQIMRELGKQIVE